MSEQFTDWHSNDPRRLDPSNDARGVYAFGDGSSFFGARMEKAIADQKERDLRKLAAPRVTMRSPRLGLWQRIRVLFGARIGFEIVMEGELFGLSMTIGGNPNAITVRPPLDKATPPASGER